jgi:hypothetical protein
MAKVNFGEMVNDARGKIAGIVFSKNKSGAYTRTKVTPANPRTVAQQAVRANFANLSQQWSGTLTAAQRSAWTSYAVTFPRRDIFGNSLTLNGLNMFVALNAVLLQIGQPVVLTPPISPAVIPAVWVNAFATLSTTVVSITESVLSGQPNAYNYIFATKCLPPGRSPTPSDFRWVYSALDLTVPGPIVFSSFYIGKFGSPIAGAAVYALIATVDGDSGNVSVSQPVSGIVA